MSAPDKQTNPPCGDFDRHTAVHGDATGPWHAQVGDELSGFSGAHGGYVGAIALRAMTKLVAEPERMPRSLTVHLLTAIAPGPLELKARLDREGTTMSATSLRVEREGVTLVTALALFGAPRNAVAHPPGPMPSVPGPQQCRPIAEKPVSQANAGLLVEHRPAAPPLPLTGGDRAEILVWMRLVEERPIDALSACMLADAGPPALYGRLSSYVAMPSTDITIHFANLAAAHASPWVLGVFRTRCADDGYAVEDGELWAPGGELVLHARQRRRVLGGDIAQ